MVRKIVILSLFIFVCTLQAQDTEKLASLETYVSEEELEELPNVARTLSYDHKTEVVHHCSWRGLPIFNGYIMEIRNDEPCCQKEVEELQKNETILMSINTQTLDVFKTARIMKRFQDLSKIDQSTKKALFVIIPKAQLYPQLSRVPRFDTKSWLAVMIRNALKK